MKILFLIAALLVSPAFVLAAFDDATLTTDTTITAGGVDLTVSGSSAVIETITVDTDSFSFTMRSGSSLKVSSSARKMLQTSAAGQYISTNECSSSASTLGFSSDVAEAVTISVTPKSLTCSLVATGAAEPTTTTTSSTSGGGGTAPAGLINPTPPSTVAQNVGLTVKPVAEAVATPTIISTTPAPPALSATAVSPVFTRALAPGRTHSDVKRLQQLLNSDPDTRIAESGAGSSGSETEYFGALTTAAIKKFQVKYGVAGPGIPGYGNLGPKTRAKLQEVFNTTPSVPVLPTTSGTERAATTPAGAVSPVFTRALAPGRTHSDVKRLQQLLNSDPDTRITATGVGSPGKETDYFGSLTTKAIQKFQVKYGVAKSGDAGYGNLGPKTRAKFQEVFEQ